MLAVRSLKSRESSLHSFCSTEDRANVYTIGNDWRSRFLRSKGEWECKETESREDEYITQVPLVQENPLLLEQAEKDFLSRH